MGYYARDKRAFGLHGMSRIGELFKVTYRAPGAEALVSEELCKLKRFMFPSDFQFSERC